MAQTGKREAIADRVRAEREIERFSQAELSKEIGVSRSALAHIERYHYPLSFSVGMAVCRRLDLNPRWLATGEEPKRPFVPLSEIGIFDRDLQAVTVRGCEFLEGYEKVLRNPLERWAKENPPEKLVSRALNVKVETLLRRYSNAELIKQLREAVEGLEFLGSKTMRKTYGNFAKAIIDEIDARFSSRR